MKSDDKPVAIVVVGVIIGVFGTIVAGWPALFAASFAISVIAVSGRGQK